MTTELTLLARTLVLAIVQIRADAGDGARLQCQRPRRQGPPIGKVTARLQRAQANLYETLPLFAAAILIAHVGGREGSLTMIGAWLYLLARIAYVPLYALGIPIVRSIVWLGSLIGVILVIAAVLLPR